MDTSGGCGGGCLGAAWAICCCHACKAQHWCTLLSAPCVSVPVCASLLRVKQHFDVGSPLFAVLFPIVWPCLTRLPLLPLPAFLHMDLCCRSVQRRSACLAAKQAALGSKQAAIDAARAAAEALAAAEEEVEGAVDQLCSLEDAIHAAVRRRSSAQDELLQRQSTLAQVVAEASTALEQHAAATRVAAATAVPGGTAAVAPAAGQRPSPLSAQQLAALASPQSGGSSRRSTGGEGAGGGYVSQRTVLAGAAVEAERVAELMEDSWFSPRLPGSELDRGEQAAPVWEQEQEVVAEN